MSADGAAGRPAPADLSLFFHPRSIAVVGAHDKRMGLSQFTDQALQLARRVGAQVYPVNPKLPEVYGVPCVASVAELPGSVDVLCVFTGDPVSILKEAAAAGVHARFVMVFANGFSELGTAAGVARERELVTAVHAIGGRLVGPNTNLNAWDPLEPLSGRKLALVAQSGNQGRSVIQAQRVGVPISYWAPTGNEADLESADFIEFFARDPETSAICAYVEGFTSGQRLREAAATAIEEDTPLVLVKVGRSDVGTEMAMSHTGHLVGSDDAYEAFFEQFGINRVDDLDELAEVGAALTRLPLPPADGVAVLSVSGGAAAHVSDLAGMYGLSLPKLTAETQAALREVIPPEFRIDNPVDNGGPVMAAGAGPRIWEICLDDPGIGLLICPVPAATEKLTEAVVETLVKVAANAAKPILPIWLDPFVRGQRHDDLWNAGLPVFSNVRNALVAARALLRHPRRNAGLHQTAKLVRAMPALRDPRRETTRTLDEVEATQWLVARGIPFAAQMRADTVADAAAAAATIGFPVVLKGTGVAHKSEHGLVKTNLASADAVTRAATEMLSEGVDGLLVARHEAGGIELLVGTTYDPVLGPVVVVGSGGVAAEALGDVCRSVLPLTRTRVATMLSRLRIAPLLDGWRGSPAVHRDAVIDTVLRIAELAAEGEIVELDINPLLARADGVVGLDALLRLRTSDGSRSA
jgi:acyl-CoA synthetase (NDP forming)